MFINKEYILNKYWKKKQPILKRMHNKILLCEKYWLLHYFNDCYNIYEALYRLKYNISECPKCKFCGKQLQWTPKKGYQTYCSKKCQCADIQDKLVQGTIAKYGISCIFQDRDKIKQSILDKYGVDNVMKLDYFKEKSKETCRKRFGVDYPSQSQQILNNTKQKFIEKYGVDNPAKSDAIKRKIKNTCIKKYGDYACNLDYVKDLAHSDLANKKRYATMKENNTFNSSKPENQVYEELCNIYGQNDVIRQYKSNAYPWNCDFYIRSKDLYIECNFHWTHGDHLFNPNDKNDIALLNKWKSKHTKYYDNAIKTWTIRDIEKAKCNVNRQVFYTINDFYEWTK